jgi:hypothetical protein
MALDPTFSEGVAIASLVFNILAVLLALPYLIVSFGFPPNSDISHRVHHPNEHILTQIEELRLELAVQRSNSDFQLEWSTIQADALISIGKTLSENMD